MTAPHEACRVRLLGSLDRLPPFSPILNRLLAELAREDVSFRALAELIEKDTVLAGNVLRLVNSPLYGLPGRVSSVRHAVAILGVVKLRNVVLSHSIARLWRNVSVPPGWSMAAFNLHSVSTAFLADSLVQIVPAPYPEGAFVAGLLHDLGKLLMAIAAPKEYDQIRALFAAGGRSIEDCELEITGTTHAELSGAALERWNLPAPIQTAVLWHHAPERSGDGVTLSHITQAADQLAAQLGYTLLPSPPGAPMPSMAAIDELGVGNQLPKMLDQFKAEFRFIRTFF